MYLTEAAVIERILRFHVRVRLPVWKDDEGRRYMRLPQAPRNGQVLVYPPSSKLGQVREYVHESALQRTDERNDSGTARARIYYVRELTRPHPSMHGAVRSMLLRDYHPDNNGGSGAFAIITKLIQMALPMGTTLNDEL